MLQSWQLVLRQGFLPQWSSETLERALTVLKADDQRLTQGSTTTPPPLMGVQDWTCEQCDFIAFCGVDDPFHSTVGEVEEGFAKSCYEADQTLGEPAACRWFLNWFDDTPRTEVFWGLISELELELNRRVQLSPELKVALTQFPDDITLKKAAYDYVLENGGSEEWAAAESGWNPQQERQ